jgi:hypothetical protein
MMDLKNELVVIERSLWTNDAEVYAASLIKEAVLVFAETGVMRRDIAVEAIRLENAEGRRWASVQFENVMCLPVAEGAALLNYRVTARWEHESSPISAYASSLYVDLAGQWKLTFHQQTPVQRA